MKKKNDLETIDLSIEKYLEDLRQSKIAYQYFSEFSTNPIGFFREWLVSQQNDLRIMENGVMDPDVYGDDGRAVPGSYLARDEILNCSAHFHKPWVNEAIKRYISDSNRTASQVHKAKKEK